GSCGALLRVATCLAPGRGVRPRHRASQGLQPVASCVGVFSPPPRASRRSLLVLLPECNNRRWSHQDQVVPSSPTGASPDSAAPWPSATHPLPPDRKRTHCADGCGRAAPDGTPREIAPRSRLAPHQRAEFFLRWRECCWLRKGCPECQLFGGCQGNDMLACGLHFLASLGDGHCPNIVANADLAELGRLYQYCLAVFIHADH